MTRSVLVVDDEEGWYAGTESLRRFGYKVDGMSDPLSAVEAVRIGPDRWDLVITDQTMPGMTGDMLAREILRIRSDMPIILCTGFSQTLT
jgi:CheY-like chemotaxis protein